MTKQLILMRHAKSAWTDPALKDHARLLNDRGRASAKAIGKWIADQGITPDKVVSSDAARTRETWDHVAPAFDTAPDIEWLPRLYLASPHTMLDALRTASGNTVLMLGHNPGIAEMAQDILARPPSSGNFQRYPTAATLIATLPIDDWRDADWHQAQPTAFIVPRDLGVY